MTEKDQKLCDALDLAFAGLLDKPTRTRVKTVNQFYHKEDVVLSVSDDPNDKSPFEPMLFCMSIQQAAAMASGVLSVIRSRCPSVPMTEASLDDAVTFLRYVAECDELPF